VALGDRRATAARNYLTAQGVAAERITLVSYGKERPSCSEHAEACWAKNRRDEFLTKER
jgi:peptidoglycan-associated lipoprotein